MIVADLALALMPGLSGLALGVVLWGIHMEFTQGVLAALLLASVIAGVLWDTWGYQATFLTRAAFAALTLIGLIALICFDYQRQVKTDWTDD